MRLGRTIIVTVVWFIEQIKEFMELNPNVKIFVIKKFRRLGHRVKVHKMKLYRAKKLALKLISDDHAKGYEKLFQYHAQIMNYNPGHCA